MLATHYYALLVLAGALTAAWMFRPRQRTQVTTLAALVSWGLAAVLGGSVEVFDGANQTVVGNVSNGTAVAVDTAGQFVAAPVPSPVRWLFGLLALLSGLAGILHVVGVYPPVTDDSTPEQ